MTVIPDLPHAEYLRMAALSVSGMKQLLPPSCPALFKHNRENQRPSKRAFDFGHLVHNMVLGEGPEFIPLPFENYLSKAAKAARDEAYAAGQIPILWEEFCRAIECAKVVRSNPLADDLLSHGKPEQSLTWTNPDGVPMRARVDWLPDKRPDRRFTAVDVKTTGGSAHPDEFARQAAKFNYCMQARHYLDGIKACGLDDDPAFVLIVVETNAPHLVSLVQFTEEDLQIAAEKIAAAVQIYRGCVESGTWPGYGEEIATIEMPAWYRMDHERDVIEEMEIA